MYQITRAAFGRSYSNRTAKVGKPLADLREAIMAALAVNGSEVRITDLVTGLWGEVRRNDVSRLTPPPGGSVLVDGHVALLLPMAWFSEFMLNVQESK